MTRDALNLEHEPVSDELRTGVAIQRAERPIDGRKRANCAGIVERLSQRAELRLQIRVRQHPGIRATVENGDVPQQRGHHPQMSRELIAGLCRGLARFLRHEVLGEREPLPLITRARRRLEKFVSRGPTGGSILGMNLQRSDDAAFPKWRRTERLRRFHMARRGQHVCHLAPR